MKLLLFLAVWALLCGISEEVSANYKYCIIGAGPSGTQLGHFLHQAGRDYAIFERAQRAAFWFSNYPVHRQLNSINKRFTRSGNAEFNLRHDWNSLIGGEDIGVELFGKWTKEYWPPADVLVEYMNAFIKPQVLANRVHFCQNVTLVSKCPGDQNCSYKLRLQQVCDPQQASNESCSFAPNAPACSSEVLPWPPVEVNCKVLVMANGMWAPRVVNDWILDLQEHSITYSQLKDIPLENFENKSVTILGAGNAATETADAIRNYARDIQIAGRYHNGRLMRESRYVGGIRGRRTTNMDANSVKSYEGNTNLFATSNDLVMVRCGPEDGINSGFMGQLPVCTFHIDEDGDVVLVPLMEVHTQLVKRVEELFPGQLFRKQPSIRMKKHINYAKQAFPSGIHFPATDILCIKLEDLRRPLTADQRKILPVLRDTTRVVTRFGHEFAKPIDVYITCLGWKYDWSMFASDVNLDMLGPARRAKDSQTYPSLTGEFESTSAAGLFIIGAASHGRDRYRYEASGGFIHGFRFNCRTLWRVLEHRYEEQRSPIELPFADDGTSIFEWNPKGAKNQQLKDLGSSYEIMQNKSKLWGHLVDRLNHAGGPYEMVGGSLVDAILYDCHTAKAFYLEDVTEDMVHDMYSRYPRLTWSYHFGLSEQHPLQEVMFCHVRSGRHAVLGSFVHPVLQYFPPGVIPEKQSRKILDPKEFEAEHPSSLFSDLEGVSRMHVRDEYMYTDWWEAEAIGQVELFMTHVEQAVRKFCMKESEGWITDRSFDEVIDTRLSDEDVVQRIQIIREKASRNCRLFMRSSKSVMSESTSIKSAEL